MNKYKAAKDQQRGERNRARARRKGELPPPPHVYPAIKRSNSWQARLALARTRR